MEWFLITDSEHLGPFSEDVMQQLFESGDVDENSLIWKEGWVDAKTYQEVFLNEPETIEEESEVDHSVSEEAQVLDEEKKSENDTPPDLPPMPSESGLDSDIEFESKVAEIKDVVSTHLDNDGENEDDDDEEVIDLEEYDFDFQKSEKNLLGKIKYVSIALIVIACIVPVGLYFKDISNVFSRPQSMSLGDYKRLTETATLSSKKLKFEFSLALDKRTLWISTNLPLEGEVFLKFKSKPGMVLGNDVELKARGILKRRLIELSEFQFIKGNKFADGVYDIEIFTVEKLDIPFYYIFFDPWEKEFRYLDQVTITSLHPREFSRQMKILSKKKEDNKTAYWSELIEKYRTVKTMTTQIKDAVNTIFTGNREQWERLVNRFETEYKNKYGVFFTSFVTTNEISYEKLINKEFDDKYEVISSYSKLTKIAKDVGSESMLILQNLESFDPLVKTEDEVEDFREKNISKLDKIIQECEIKIKSFEN